MLYNCDEWLFLALQTRKEREEGVIRYKKMPDYGNIYFFKRKKYREAVNN